MERQPSEREFERGGSLLFGGAEALLSVVGEVVAFDDRAVRAPNVHMGPPTRSRVASCVVRHSVFDMCKQTINLKNAKEK